MKTLYLDIFSGLSGDMFLGALIDLGVEAPRLERELAKLKLKGYHLHVGARRAGSIRGIKFDVHLDGEAASHHRGHSPEDSHHHPHDHHCHHPPRKSRPIHERNFADIRKLIDKSTLSPWVKEKAVAVFHRLAVAEGKVHGIPPNQVHFHEVGAVDSIVDIVGVCIGLEWLGRPRVLSAPVVDGRGWVECAHGRFPVPTAATLEILGARGVKVTQCEEATELVTPTGAALLAEFAESFGPLDQMVIARVGYGVGSRTLASRPNCVRAIWGETSVTEQPSPACNRGNYGWESDSVAVVETNLDDVSPEILGHFLEAALAAGALDVFHTPAQMKKNRPGVLLTVICPPAEAERFAALMLRETSAFGVRWHLAARRKLAREFQSVKTAFGPIQMKLGRLDGQVVQAAPEFESCRQAAARAGVALKEVYEAAVQSFHHAPRHRPKNVSRPA